MNLDIAIACILDEGYNERVHTYRYKVDVLAYGSQKCLISKDSLEVLFDPVPRDSSVCVSSCAGKDDLVSDEACHWM